MSTVFSGMLEDVHKTLSSSSKCPFDEGYIQDWADWAHTMKANITAVLPVINRMGEAFEDIETTITQLEVKLASKDELLAEKDRMIMKLLESKL